ncbi:hypothetical protein AVEN_87037-1 [Araneus ventricosus]|uniref:Reverse transcriptase/retrotransposon-derived protein RNase H-like domain-containing protein n=1 Tax=Araneus ventricosus TaxID=182803 RepID=A0A4Y2SF59_ARAVE|nr:hypothetical protein AVEN_87037-1 [Araneus ventricosus]
MKIGPVFDASDKTPYHPSLNDYLETGFNLVETIPSVSPRFRLHKIGDILHTFVDASQTAYSACVFLRSEIYNDKVIVQLLQEKSRITSLKKITIPRLDLMAATIGARLFNSAY